MRFLLLALLLAGCASPVKVKKDPVLLHEDKSPTFHYQVWEEYDDHGKSHRYILELYKNTRKDWK